MPPGQSRRGSGSRQDPRPDPRQPPAPQGTDAEGAWTLHARGTIEAGAAFNAVFQPIIDEMFRQARGERRHEPREAYAFDALIELTNRTALEDDDIDADEADEADRSVDTDVGVARSGESADDGVDGTTAPNEPDDTDGLRNAAPGAAGEAGLAGSGPRRSDRPVWRRPLAMRIRRRPAADHRHPGR